MKKKPVALLLALTMVLCCFAACGGAEAGEEAASDEGAAGDAPLKVVCLINGYLGDKSFYDSAALGMTLIKDQLGCDTKVVELGREYTILESTLYEFAESDYDIIIMGTYQMQELLAEVAPQFPDKRFILFDSEVEADNVYSIAFKQNEVMYLAGSLAAQLSVDERITNGSGIISAVVGLNTPLINDFIVGYIEGAKAAVPDIKVALSYIGDFTDTARAKELANAQIGLGSAVVFQCAAQAGLGTIEACRDNDTLCIGVDSDQAAALRANDPAASALIVTSVLKNIDQALLRAVKLHMEGSLPYGTVEALGITENAVGLVDNDIYRGLVPAEIIASVEELQAKIQSGEIVVSSAFDMTIQEIEALKASVQP